MTAVEDCTKCGGPVRMYETGSGASAGTCPHCGHYQCIAMTSRRIPEMGALTGIWVEWPETEASGRRICRTHAVSFRKLDRFIDNLRRNGITDWFFGPMIHRRNMRWYE